MAKTSAKRCPECGKKFPYGAVKDHPGFPFCSERCKVIDLARWLKHEYAVVEDLKEGLDLKAGEIDDPDVRAAIDELNDH
jgi:endogenous inhibitor of DNA gyrase (YacG/DUF329 family)